MIISSELSDSKRLRLLLSIVAFAVGCVIATLIFSILIATQKVKIGDTRLRYQLGELIFKMPFITKTPEYIALSAWKNFQISGFKSAQVSLSIKQGNSSWKQEVNVDLSTLGETLQSSTLSEITYTIESLTPIPSYKLVYKSPKPFSRHDNVRDFMLEIWVDQSSNRPYQAVVSFSRDNQSILLFAQPSSDNATLTIEELLLLNPPQM